MDRKTDREKQPRGRVLPAAQLLTASAAQTAAYLRSAALMSGRFARRRLTPPRPPAYPVLPAGELAGDGSPVAEGEARPRPRISVILPAYNAVRDGRGYFQEALESVATQTYPPLELIVVDDGSSDASGEAAAAFAAANPELSVTLLRQENGGQSSARNLGAGQAAGDWLAFLDQDDRWKHHRLAVVAAHLDERTDLIYTDADTIDADGRPRERAIHKTLGLGGGHPLRCPAAALARDVFVMPGVMTIRASFYRRLGGFDPMLSGYEDDDLFVRAVHRGRLAYVPEATLEWRTDHGGNSSGTQRMVDSRTYYWRKLVRDFAGGGADAALTRRITTRFFLECLRQATMCFEAGGQPSGGRPSGDPPARGLPSGDLPAGACLAGDSMGGDPMDGADLAGADLAPDPIVGANLAAADLMCPGLGPVDRLAYTTTRWAWTRRDRRAYLVRWWLLNGLERSGGGS